MTVGTARYEFGETGAGCSEHGLATCLCDVTLPDPPTQICYATDEIRFGSFACDRADTFTDWAEIILGCAEALASRPEMFEALDILRASKEKRAAQAGQKQTPGERMATERRIAATLMSGGCDLEETSAIMGLTIQNLVRLMVNGGRYPSTLLGWTEDQLLAFERRILGAPLAGTTYVEIAQEFNVPRNMVKRVADWYGIELLIKVSPVDVRTFVLALDRAVSAKEAQAQVLGAFGVDVSTASIYKWRSRALATV